MRVRANLRRAPQLIGWPFPLPHLPHGFRQPRPMLDVVFIAAGSAFFAAAFAYTALCARL